MRHPRIIAVIVTACLLAATSSFATTVVIQNNDSAGEGFNDPTLAAPVGGNPGTTVGAQRLNAFTYAANLWAACLTSNVTIVVAAQMNPLTCTSMSAILGSAGAVSVVSDFPNAPLAATWYPVALANALAGFDLDPGVADISAQFNSNLNGSAGCLGGRKWYYGYDLSPPGSDIDFVSVVTHEIGHGLGFQTFVNLATGQKLNGLNDQYMVKLDRSGAVPSDYPSMSDAQRVSASTSDPNLRWIGANVDAFQATIPLTAGLSGVHVRVHAPNPAVPGSSVSHFSTAVIPNEIMEPNYTGPNHNILLSRRLMKDIGWVLPGATTVGVTDTLTVHRQPTSWTLKVKVKNTGTTNALGVNTLMSGGPGWLSITDPIGTYPDLAAGASAFNSDTYLLNLTGWPGGAFSVNLQIFYSDACGEPHNQIVAVNLNPTTGPTPVTPVPTFVNRLDVNVPNPFNPSTTIHYEIGEGGNASLRIYDVSGALVRSLVNRIHSPGDYETRWDGRDDGGRPSASGVYFYRLETESYAETRRMVLLK